MKKVIKLSESDFKKLVLRALKEAEHEHNRYMFFSNLEQMKRQAERLLELDHDKIHAILENGHDWADDHITVAKENLDQVFDFMMNEIEGNGEELMMAMDMDIMEAKKKNRKKTGTPLCARGKAAAKAKYDVYPSAYANGYAVQVCQGEQPGLDGKKRCSGAYC
jgi:N12 class adenine-specific DNA methylase